LSDRAPVVDGMTPLVATDDAGGVSSRWS